MADKVLSLLGLARRAGKVLGGFDLCAQARAGKSLRGQGRGAGCDRRGVFQSPAGA